MSQLLNYAQIERMDPKIANLASLYTVVDTMAVDLAKDWTVLSEYCEITDATARGVYMFGGRSGAKHFVGSTTAVPTTAGTTTNWGADPSYPGGLVIASVVGGYDTVANQTGGGTILANHCIVKYNIEGHSIIVGGSACVLAGGRAYMAGNEDCEIGPACVHSTMVTSKTSELQNANYAYAACLLDCDIQGARNVAVSCQNVTSASGTFNNFIYGANTATLTGSTQYCIISGTTITAASAQKGIAIGDTLSLNHTSTVMVGKSADSPGNYAYCRSSQILQKNDCRDFSQLDYKRTTNAVITNTNFLGTTLPTGKTVAGFLRITVTALRDGTATGDSSGIYTTGTWTGDIGFRWDGTNGYLYTSATIAGPTTSPTINLTAVRDDIGVAALPLITISTGILRCQLTGKASSTINWVIRYEVLNTLVS